MAMKKRKTAKKKAAKKGGRKKTAKKRSRPAGARVVRFVRYEVGLGLEKKQENFAAEVMAQVEAARDKGKPDKPS